mgnify:FL=1
MKNNNWQIKYLKDLCIQAGEYGLNAPAISFTKEFPLYLRITDITDDGIYSDKQRVSVAYTGTEKLLNNNDFLFARTGATVGKTYLNRQTDEKIAFAGYLIRFVPDLNKILPYYLVLYCQTKPYWKWVKIFSIRSGQPGISAEEYGKLPIPCPPIEEQRRIVEVLECWDKGIELVKKLIEQKELQKKYLMQQLLSGALRLNGFTDKWKKCGFKELFVSVKGTTSMQIQSSEYLSNGEFPIVDQGQEQIVGFSNQKNKLYKDLPVIVFGDHTRIIKYIDFPFIIGADGTKLLKVNLAYNIRFLYYILLNAPIPNLGYSRHLSLLKQMFFYIPEKRQEQQAIAEVLSSADKEIDLLKQKLAKLEAQKKGLMQVLLTGKIRLK